MGTSMYLGDFVSEMLWWYISRVKFLLYFLFLNLGTSSECKLATYVLFKIPLLIGPWLLDITP